MHFAQHSQITAHGDTSLKACLEGDLHQLTNGAVSPAESGTTVMALAANVPVGWSPCPGHLKHPALVYGDGHPTLAIQSQPSPLARGELVALFTLSHSPQFSLLLRELFRTRKEHQVCAAQVAETCIFLLNTGLMINNYARDKASSTTLSSQHILFTYLLIADCWEQTPASLQIGMLGRKMEPGLKGLQRLIYRGRLKELNLCCLAKQQLMGEGWMADYRNTWGDATDPDHIPGMFPPPCYSRQAWGIPHSHAASGFPPPMGMAEVTQLWHMLGPKSRGTTQLCLQLSPKQGQQCLQNWDIQRADNRLICPIC